MEGYPITLISLNFLLLIKKKRFSWSMRAPEKDSRTYLSLIVEKCRDITRKCPPFLLSSHL